MTTRFAHTASRPDTRALSSEPVEKVFVSAINRLHRGKLTINFPSGYAATLEGSQDKVDGIQFHGLWNLNSYRAIKRCITGKSVGFAEGYIEGEWDTPDLTHLLELMAENMDAIEAAIRNWGVVKTWNRLQHFFRSNSKRGSRRNIAYHYDLGNDFYTEWLDPSMTYSAALFDAEHQGLEAAQLNKYRALADKLELRPEHHVLEIGCGWGGFAEFAAREYGCRIVCLTLSTEQLSFARERIRKAGLSDRVEFRLQDYRDVQGCFDRIVSIEMFEAVGEEYWDTYFRKVNECLAPDGKAGLQIITIANERFEGYRSEADFIQKYIFPGGMLPSPEKLAAHIESAGLGTDEGYTFGQSYARTLELWRRAFLNNWHKIEALGYTKRFRRMWEYYLCYCEAGFRRETIDVGHYFLAKKEPLQGT